MGADRAAGSIRSALTLFFLVVPVACGGPGGADGDDGDGSDGIAADVVLGDETTTPDGNDGDGDGDVSAPDGDAATPDGLPDGLDTEPSEVGTDTPGDAPSDSDAGPWTDADAPVAPTDIEGDLASCPPGTLCPLESSWPCVEGKCTSLGQCAPSPIPDCCVSDSDCAGLVPDGACSFYVCSFAGCVQEDVPGCCDGVTDCDDGDPCTDDQCPWPGAGCQHCPLGCACPNTEPSLDAGFDGKSLALMGFGVTDPVKTDLIAWRLDTRRWVRPPQAAHLTHSDCPTYYSGPLDEDCQPVVLPGAAAKAIQGTLTAPTLTLEDSPAGHVALMWMWADVDGWSTGGDGETDVLRVSLEDLSAGKTWPLTSSLAVGKDTEGDWRLLAVDLSAWTSMTVALHFTFDTLTDADNHHEGVYVDDIQIVPRCTGGCCAEDEDCASLQAEDGCQVARCITLEASAGTVCALVPTFPGQACEACQSNGDCVDANPCTTDVCTPGGVCDHSAFCCFEYAAAEVDFDQGLGGWYILDNDLTDGVGWKSSTPALPGGNGIAWIVDPETSTYDTSATVDVTLRSPVLTLPTAGEEGAWIGVSFWLKLSTEWDGQLYDNPAGIDRLSISVDKDGLEEIWSSDEIGGTTDGAWIPVTVPLDAWAGETMQLRIRFDTVDGYANQYLGPLLDDLRIGRLCP